MLALFLNLNQEDRDFVSDLYKSYKDRLYSLALSLLKNKADAEDALSTTYIKIIENIERIKALPEEKLSSYIFVILYNQAMDIFRQKNKFSEIENFDQLVDEKNPSTYDQVETNLLVADLLKHIKALPLDDQRLLILKYKYDMAYKDIAKLLNISPRAARKRKERLVKTLENKLKGVDKND
ncbi:RNA polymerase sigma factor [Neofamilia massiliensis]|uniref:RNA polymerase sigma factor n=1 Tax=Neofamilia massiliensis TaxID=1673724 RepID=UPI0006BB5FCB|nr:sigma-70 family RNA polymerase sigma factor [Neofamilia massiliensis]